METNDAYKQKLKAQLKDWNAQINIAQTKLLAARMENTGAIERLIYARELDVLHAKQREASKRIKELEGAAGDAWEMDKVSTDKVWDDLRSGIDQGISIFK